MDTAHTRARVTLRNPPPPPRIKALDSARAGWRVSTSLPTRPSRRPGRGAPCVCTSLPASCSAAQVLLGAGQAQLLGQNTGLSGTTCRQALHSGHGPRPCLSEFLQDFADKLTHLQPLRCRKQVVATLQSLYTVGANRGCAALT